MNIWLKISWQEDSFRACEMLFQEQAEQRARRINCIIWNLENGNWKLEFEKSEKRKEKRKLELSNLGEKNGCK
jgi:neutral trehalase